MNLFHAAVLGLVQGLTEFIPVSSSAHLIIVPWLFGWPDPGLAFDAALHLGTLAALLVYFRKDWLEVVKGFCLSVRERRIGMDPTRLMAWLIIIGTIPGGVAGILLEKTVDAAFHAPEGAQAGWSMVIMAALIAGLACLLAVAEKTARHIRPLTAIGWRDGILVGLAQAAALFPGVSRSGATLTAGLFRGLRREAAARFSFLLACPLVAGAGMKKVHDLLKHGLPASDRAGLAVGLLIAAVSGYLCIAFLLRYLQRHSTMPFVWYRLALASFILVFLLVR